MTPQNALQDAADSIHAGDYCDEHGNIKPHVAAVFDPTAIPRDRQGILRMQVFINELEKLWRTFRAVHELLDMNDGGDVIHDLLITPLYPCLINFTSRLDPSQRWHILRAWVAMHPRTSQLKVSDYEDSIDNSSFRGDYWSESHALYKLFCDKS
jgi:hypothetical protein